jgi:hypothetical protein
MAQPPTTSDETTAKPNEANFPGTFIALLCG